MRQERARKAELFKSLDRTNILTWRVRGGGGGFRSFFIFVVSKVTTFPVGLSVPTCLKTKWKL